MYSVYAPNTSGTLTITDTDILSSTYGIRLHKLATIMYNNIVGNSCYGVYNSNTGITVNVENNWWGDASGPAPLGTGNAINAPYVDATPWLTQPTGPMSSLWRAAFVRSYRRP
jgi:hypothetical protein